MPLHVVRHPLIEDALGRLRDRDTPCDEFRRLARRVSLLLAAEATRDLALGEAPELVAGRGAVAQPPHGVLDQRMAHDVERHGAGR